MISQKHILHCYKKRNSGHQNTKIPPPHPLKQKERKKKKRSTSKKTTVVIQHLEKCNETSTDVFPRPYT